MSRCRGVNYVATNVDPDSFGEFLSLAGTQKMQGGLPAVTSTAWRKIAAAFPGLTGLGAWGDRSHRARKSDHNLGFAIDCMTRDRKLGDACLRWLLVRRVELGIAYVIWFGRIYSPKNKWVGRPYLGLSRHTDHLHVSFVH